MPKLSAVQSALISVITAAVAIGVALGFVKGTAAQVIVATVPSLIANLFVVGAAIVTAIHDHTAAVTAK